MKTIAIADFNYNLPDSKIAKYPLEQRDSSKLLVYKNQTISETYFSQLHNNLPENSLLVMNNTRVIRARLLFRKATGAEIEIFCLEPHLPSDYYQSFQNKANCEWHCIAGNLKKWKEGSISLDILHNGQEINIIAEKVVQEQESLIVRFSWKPSHLSFGELLELAGNMPIPPYLNRDSETIDKERYQTVYAQSEGSVAAPTAGLHFTSNVFENLKNKEIHFSELTLHVGAGTFKPVKSPNAMDHPMHTEHFSFSRKNIEDFLKFENNITAVGTTSLRALESIYWIGVKLQLDYINPFHIGQFEPYHLNKSLSLDTVLKKILHYMQLNRLEKVEATTSIMIFPGYTFHLAQRLLTNFHQPQSTLLLLVAAFVGEKQWRKIYDYALGHDFRFLSYGDSSLLNR